MTASDIQDLVNAADPDEPVTIVLNNDANIDGNLTLDRDVTIDINGSNLTI